MTKKSDLTQRESPRNDVVPIIVIIGVMCLVCILSCAGMEWIPMRYNDWRLLNLAAQVAAYPLPPQTKVVDIASEFRNIGNGNNCLFTVTQTVETQLERDVLEVWYDDVVFTLAGVRQDLSSTVYVSYPQDGEGAAGFEAELHIIIELGNNIDMRCH